MIVAYMRISTNKEIQKHDRQEKALQDYANDNNFQINEWYKDTVSGKVITNNRPNYQYLKNKLKQGDTLIVSDLDRLGRNANNIIIEIKDLQNKGVTLIALDIPYMNEWNRMNDDSLSKMIIDIVVTLKAHMAEQEREKTIIRINQGLDVAKSKGIKLGRPTKTLSQEFIKQYEKYINGEYGKITATGFAKMLGIGRSTLYKYIEQYEKSQKN